MSAFRTDADIKFPDCFQKFSHGHTCVALPEFLVSLKLKKYRLENHPNYKYTAEADKSYLKPNTYLLEYSNEEIEQVRVKAVGEEGYIEPRIIESARRRAMEQEKKRKAK